MLMCDYTMCLRNRILCYFHVTEKACIPKTVIAVSLSSLWLRASDSRRTSIHPFVSVSVLSFIEKKIKANPQSISRRLIDFHVLSEVKYGLLSKFGSSC